MPVTVQQVLEIMKELAPPALACSWDNVGLLVDAGRPVTGILTALDITPAVVAEATEKGCELIISHHPVIFDPLKSLTTQDVPALLLKNGISGISMHTNYDAAPGGVNDTLAALLGLQNATNFAEDCGRIGDVPQTDVPALAKLCESKLGAHIKYAEATRPVKRLAVVSGAGGSFLQEAIALGADCFVTGEAAHHIGILARKTGTGLIVAGHFATEHPAMVTLVKVLAARLPSVKIANAAADKDPFDYL